MCSFVSLTHAEHLTACLSISLSLSLSLFVFVVLWISEDKSPRLPASCFVFALRTPQDPGMFDWQAGHDGDGLREMHQDHGDLFRAAFVTLLEGARLGLPEQGSFAWHQHQFCMVHGMTGSASYIYI